MNDRVSITVDGPPIGKGRPRFVRSTGHAYTPPATAAYEAVVGWTAREAMAGHPPMNVPLWLSMHAYMPVPGSWSKKRTAQALDGLLWPSRPDLDNVFKVLMDALNGVVWADDKQIVEAELIKSYSDRPRLEVTVEPKEFQLQDSKF